MSISVLILTLNEERNLPACLNSVAWSDDIVVFDSLSTDRTCEMARAAGARVIQRPFDNEREHRLASLGVGFKHRWVYNPDADEITPPELQDEMLARTSETAEYAAYRVRRKDMFMGKWIKHSSLYPTWLVRLFRPECIGFERSINLRTLVRGSVGTLYQHMHHYSFNNGLDAWFAKHNQYSRQEAIETLQALEEPLDLWGLFSHDPRTRRRSLKDLSFRLPCRPGCRFLYNYLIRGGFLDGRPGFTYSSMIAIYDYMITLKVAEVQCEKSRNRHFSARSADASESPSLR